MNNVCVDCIGDEPCVAEEPDAFSVTDYQDATWLVIAASDYSSVQATSFAIAPQLLGTNAHVVEGILAVMAEPNSFAVVVQHESGESFPVTEVWSHPEYDNSALSPDVGLLKIDGNLPIHLSIGTDSILQQLEVFDVVRLCGFPGSITSGVDVQGILTTGDFHPRATCLNGSVSAIRPFDSGQSATPANTFLIQYDISTEQGVSGSAVFDEHGNLIGVHALGFSEESEQNFAIRADKLQELLTLVEVENHPGQMLADIPLGQPAPIFVPVTNMDVLRTACWFETDAKIIESVDLIDELWYLGESYAEQYDRLNSGPCGSNPDCWYCWASMIDFVYLVAH